MPLFGSFFLKIRPYLSVGFLIALADFLILSADAIRMLADSLIVSVRARPWPCGRKEKSVDWSRFRTSKSRKFLYGSIGARENFSPRIFTKGAKRARIRRGACGKDGRMRRLMESKNPAQLLREKLGGKNYRLRKYVGFLYFSESIVTSMRRLLWSIFLAMRWTSAAVVFSTSCL